MGKTYFSFCLISFLSIVGCAREPSEATDWNEARLVVETPGLIVFAKQFPSELFLEEVVPTQLKVHRKSQEVQGLSVFDPDCGCIEGNKSTFIRFDTSDDIYISARVQGTRKSEWMWLAEEVWHDGRREKVMGKVPYRIVKAPSAEGVWANQGNPIYCITVETATDLVTQLRLTGDLSGREFVESEVSETSWNSFIDFTLGDGRVRWAAISAPTIKLHSAHGPFVKLKAETSQEVIQLHLKDSIDAGEIVNIDFPFEKGFNVETASLFSGESFSMVGWVQNGAEFSVQFLYLSEESLDDVSLLRVVGSFDGVHDPIGFLIPFVLS